MTKRKQTDKEIIAEIRRKFEAGYNLIDLAAEYCISYGTLRNISSKEDWEKGSRAEAIRIAELNADSEKQVKERQAVKNKYKRIVKRQVAKVEDLQKDKNLGKDKEAEEALLTRVKTIGELYKIDKELYNITTSKEDEDIRTKRLKNQKLIDELEDKKNEGTHIS